MEKKRIIVVNDSAIDIKKIVSWLDPSWFQVDMAGSGIEGIEKVRTLLPDLVIVDMFMEDMNGLQVAKVIRDNRVTSNIPIVIVSPGEVEASHIERHIGYLDGIILKPVQRELLVNMVQALLGMVVRRSRRVTTSIPCAIIFDEKEMPATIHSIGVGGGFVEGAQHLRRGDVCGLRFNLPGTDRIVEVYNASIVWKGKENGGEIEGIGLNFLTISEEDRKSLDEYIDAILEPGEGRVSGQEFVNAWF